MLKTLTIEAANRPTWKERLKTQVGGAVSAVLPARSRSLYRAPVSDADHFLDRMMVAYLRHRALEEGRARFLERLHSDFWQGEGGSVFSGNCDHRFEDLFLRKQAEDFQVLSDTWTQRTHTSIVEFGCNSGLLLQHLTTSLPGVEHAIGVDLNQAQILANQVSDGFDPRIQFVCEDASSWLKSHGGGNCLFVTNGGVLEYFRRDRLLRLLTTIATHRSPATFFAVEPVAEDHDLDSDPRSIPFGEELSFSHNYRQLFEAAGFTVIHQRAVYFESWKWLATVATV